MKKNVLTLLQYTITQRCSNKNYHELVKLLNIANDGPNNQTKFRG